ncbi:hypothetical protein ABID96_001481 [Bacillus sp. OAE603]
MTFYVSFVKMIVKYSKFFQFITIVNDGAYIGGNT